MTKNKANVLRKNAAMMRIVLEHHEKGESCKAIGRKVGLSGVTVSSFLRASGKTLNRQPGKKTELIGNSHARCSRCASIHPVDEWPAERHWGKKRLRSFCSACFNKKLMRYINSSTMTKLRAKHIQLVSRQKREGKVFPISLKELVVLWETQGGKCFYTGVPRAIDGGMGKRPNSMSIDRVEPNLGYELSNVVLAANRINGMKGDASLAEMREWMPAWYYRIVTYHYWDAAPGIKTIDLRLAA